MKTFLCVILGVMLVLSVGYGAHDLACYAIIEPGGDYVQADSTIIPKLGIANLGDEAEHNFPVEFLAINQEEEDTVFADTTIVDYIGPYPDSVEVEFDEWIPDGICQDFDWRYDGPFICYDLLGIVAFKTDEELTNGTVRDSVTCLWAHDVGVVDIVIMPDPDEPPDRYDAGSVIIITATVENFGCHMEHDVPVRCEIWDEDADTLIYNNLQLIADLDWRGNPHENPYTTEVTFPNWTTPNENWFSFGCRTEMEGDLCPDDDFYVLALNTGIEKTLAAGMPFALEAITPNPFAGSTMVFFAVPYTSWVKMDIFDVNGRWVKSIASDIFGAGHYTRSWDCRDAQGRKVATGVYLIRMQADEFSDVQKIVLLH